jgi:hypothetical protein
MFFERTTITMQIYIHPSTKKVILFDIFFYHLIWRGIAADFFATPSIHFSGFFANAPK